jgi:ribonuclease Y
MDMSTGVILGIVGSWLVVFAVGWLLAGWVRERRLKDTRQRAEELLAETRREAEREKQKFLLRAKEEWFRARDEKEKDLKQRLRKLEIKEQQLVETEKQLQRKEDSLKQREGNLTRQENSLEARRAALKVKEEEYSQLLSRYNVELSRVARLSPEEAKERLLENLRKEFRAEASQLYKSIIDRARENANKEAREIITRAIERNASDQTLETTVAVVNLPSDEIKGRIIGKDGRNIKTFESLTGVKVIVDDTPEAVVLSSYDPVKREIARVALQRLVQNGKIHPQRVEEAVAKAEQEVEKQIWRAGNEAVASVGVGRMHPDLIRILGRLHFRTSYGQNVLQHSIEVARITGALAAELKLDVRLAKRAGLLHDIGKAVSQNTEGTHTQIGIEIAQKYKEDPVVINAIAAHHEDEEATSLITVLVSAADAISGARPGARRDTLDGYVRRIEKLEKIADSFDAVAKAYAISAGREIRVMVQPERVSDPEAMLLARDIAKKIQSDLEYPGEVKVTVIRESRAVSYA